MEIPKQVIEAAFGLGTEVKYIGVYQGENVYEVYTLAPDGCGVETGMPILAFFDGKTARIEINSKNLSILTALNAS